MARPWCEKFFIRKVRAPGSVDWRRKYIQQWNVSLPGPIDARPESLRFTTYMWALAYMLACRTFLEQAGYESMIEHHNNGNIGRVVGDYFNNRR